MRKILKRIIPNQLKKRILNILNEISIKKAYKYDFKRYFKYSATRTIDNKSKLIGRITMTYHIIEKGLTMPNMRLGFGAEKIKFLIDSCNNYISRYDSNNIQLLHAIKVLLEYKYVHKQANYTIDPLLSEAIEEFEMKFKNITLSHQIEFTKEDFFKYRNATFDKFSESRRSIRNYTDENIPMEAIMSSIALAQNTPSACNRQTSRVYIYENKEEINKILDIQGGNRGFGHLTNKLIVLTAEQGVFSGGSERNQCFIDGGMYAMNLLYGLHYNKIATCILNCSNSVDKDEKLRELCKIKESEVFIAMFSCGYPPAKFSIAASQRNSVDDIVTIYN